MSVSEPRNLAASVRQRLLNLARERGEDFSFLLTASVALTAEFSEEPARRQQWKAFLDRIGQQEGAPGLPDVMEALSRFLAPPLAALRADVAFPLRWPAGGPWIDPG